MTLQATREIRPRDDRPSLIKEGFDFGFGSFFPGGLLGALPVGAGEIVGDILDSIRAGGSVAPVVISERPTTSLPSDSGTETVPTSIDLPPGFHYCEIAGETRICEDEPFTGSVGVFEPFDPDVVIGEVKAPDTTEQVDDSVTNGDDDMAHDWGHLIRESIGGLILPDPPSGASGYVDPTEFWGQTGPVASSAMIGGTSSMNGKCKRRRRRRLLTEGDFNDLMRIGTLPNKDTVKVALAKAVGRR